MKCDMILAGVGGQGILSIAGVVCSAAVHNGLHIKQSEVHGMAQRGGAVQAHVRIADQPIYSDLIPRGGADLILGMEPMESLRYLPWLRDGGTVISNGHTIRNTAAYPDDAEVLKTLESQPGAIVVDASGIARRLGQPRAMNMALVGAASGYLPLDDEWIEQAILNRFARKGEKVVEMNLAIFRAGREGMNNGAESLRDTLS